ncbi:MAG: transketolase [Candidatus Babeliales bacterium]
MLSKLSKEKLSFLKKVALNLRIDSIRATTASKSGHPTSCMSAADLVATVFFNFLKYDLNNPDNPNNDRFILSKGHAIPVIYAAYKQLGVITDQELLNLRKFDSNLEGHPTPKFKYNEAATGSLGQGLAVGLGMAINAKKEDLSYKTFVLMGDGELAEGSIWEAAQIAAYYKTDNLIGIVDCNRLGQSGESIQDHHTDNLVKKFESFGWRAIAINGHDITQIFDALLIAYKQKNQPVILIAKTYKGYGLKNIQDKNGYHGKPFDQKELDVIIKDLKNFFEPDIDKDFVQKKYEPELPDSVKIEEDYKKQNITINLAQDLNSNLFDKNKSIATRKAFGYALAALGRQSKNIIAIDGDVKNSTYTEIFEKEFSEQFIQCFIAEQSMIGIATGLQSRGKIPFAATFGCFFSRAYDQIRMAGIGRNALRIVGSHCGVSIGQDGPSQMALEDIAMFAAIPDSIILYPSDGVSAYKLTELMANYHDGISYLRTSRPETQIIYDKNEEFKIGGCKILKLSKNDQACILAAGVTVEQALKAYEELKIQNIFVSVIDLYSIKPLDINTIKEVAKKSNNKIITVEDHYIQGGVGQIVASNLVNSSINIEILAVTQLPRSGSPEELMAFEQIDSKNIVKKVLGK